MKNQMVFHSITTALVYAFLEWILIFLLFLDASFSFLVTKFARYCQLQIPCLLCSRLDHILGKEKSGFYWNLVCHNHKIKISTLVLCHLHNNLVDVHGMCEGCLFSFSTINKPNAETLVGKLGDEPHVGLNPDSRFANDIPNSLDGRKCTCCNEQFISRGYTELFFHTKTVGYHPVSFASCRVVQKEFTDVLSQKVIASPSAEPDIEHLPHIKYEMVKITSDTESTGYDIADLSEPLLGTSGHNKDELGKFIDVSSQKVVSSLSEKDDIDSLLCVEDENLEVTIDTKSMGYETTDLDSPLLVRNRPDRTKPKDFTDISSQKVKASQARNNNINNLPHIEYETVKITSETESEACFSNGESVSNPVRVVNDGNRNVATENGARDFIVGNIAPKKVMNPSDTPQPSNLHSKVYAEAADLCSMASVAPIGHGLEELNWKDVEHKTDGGTLQLVSSSNTLPSSISEQSSAHMQGETFNLKGVAELEKETIRKYDEMAESVSSLTSTSGRQSDPKFAISDASMQTSSLLELSDAYKLAVGSSGRQSSEKLLEQKAFKDSTGVSEDLKHLLSQLSAARGIELQLTDMSPRISGNLDESKTDASGSIGMQILQSRISIERNESGISLDGSTVSEIEGENIVDRLKRQVEHDKKLIGALYKELEEERNASAVAANQAMAMITRLQEEKAALHMEALQCLRMMEEQSEYDGEALQKANDLLAEKEKEILDLEAELELCKRRLCWTVHVEPSCDFNIQKISEQKLQTSLEQGSTTILSSGHDISTTHSIADHSASFSADQDICSRTSLAFENEALHVLQCLKKLEKKLELFSYCESLPDTAHVDFSEEENVEVANWKKLAYRRDTKENGETDIDLKNPIVHIESSAAPEGSAFQHKYSECEGKGWGELQSGQHFSRDFELDALRNEFLVLNCRVKALETEHSFLEHSMISLCKGEEGLKFIQEMAHQVGELYTTGVKRGN